MPGCLPGCWHLTVCRHPRLPNLWRIACCIRLVVSIIAYAAGGFAERTLMTHSPLVVLGGGPGGYAAAFFAADEGLEVTIVEAEGKLGGTCLLRGCIPSKALLHVARVIAEVDELRADWGVEYSIPKIDVAKVRARKDKVLSQLSQGLGMLAKSRKVKVIKARGIFQDST